MSLRWTTLTVAALVAACGEPTRAPSGPLAAAPDDPATPVTQVSAFALAWADEADRLFPAVGDGLSEQPLRLALRIVRQRVAADQTADGTFAVDEAKGLVESYRWEGVTSLDPAELDAIELLITSIDEAMTADRAAESALELPASITNHRRPS